MNMRKQITVATCLLSIGTLATCLVYWVGLNGPFILDDEPVLGVVNAWLAGNASLQEVLFGNVRWLDNRSLAMASFAANAWIDGYAPRTFKLGNLAIHLACGAVIYLLLRRLLRRDVQLKDRGPLAAAIIATVWLLHPLQASTVLYAVQRMAQIATLACLLGIWLYIVIRDRLDQGKVRWSVLALFVGIPVLIVLGIQSKQSAAILPALCLVVELAWYRNQRLPPAIAMVFFATVLLLPAVLLATVLFVRPELLLAGYVEYDFSPWQRLITQPLVLCDYVRQLLIPYTPSMGVFTDGYPISDGLLRPASTLVAIVALGGTSCIAIGVRHLLPSVFGGWFIFLTAHAVESSFLPLEMYYEHRNYLHSLWIFLACASMIAALGSKLITTKERRIRILAITAGAVVVALAASTHGRARVWSDSLTLVQTEWKHHPRSIRAIANYSAVLAELGALEEAYRVLDPKQFGNGQPRLTGQVMILRAALDCRQRGVGDAIYVRNAIETLPPHLDLNTFLALEVLTKDVQNATCGQLNISQVADLLVLMADRAAEQPDDFNQKWALRNRAAMLYAESGRWHDALVQARKGWQPSTPGAGAAPLVEIMLVNGKVDEAERLYVEAWARTASRPFYRQQLERIRPLIDNERREAGWNRRRVAPITGR